MPDQPLFQSAFFEPGEEFNLPVAVGGVSVKENQPCRMTLLAGKAANLPSVGQTAALRQDCVVLGLAPGRWLVVYDTETTVADEFATDQLFASDHSDAWAVMTVSGAKATDVLQALCPVDMHPVNFVNDTCFQSRIGGSPALVFKNGSDGRYRVFIPRSSARAVLEDICDMAAFL